MCYCDTHYTCILLLYDVHTYIKKNVCMYMYIIRRSLDTVNQYFDDLILKDQDVLKDESCWNKVLGCIPNEGKYLISNHQKRN